MKISEMIAALQKAQAEIGDVPVAMVDSLEVLKLDWNADGDCVFVSDRHATGWQQWYYWTAEQKAERKARHDTPTMPLGKHRGKPVFELNTRYLTWCLKNSRLFRGEPTILPAIKAEKKERQRLSSLIGKDFRNGR